MIQDDQPIRIVRDRSLSDLFESISRVLDLGWMCAPTDKSLPNDFPFCWTVIDDQCANVGEFGFAAPFRRWSCRRHDRQGSGEVKRCSAALAALHPNPALHQLDETMGYRQSQTGSSKAPRSGRIHL